MEQIWKRKGYRVHMIERMAVLYLLVGEYRIYDQNNSSLSLSICFFRTSGRRKK